MSTLLPLHEEQTQPQWWEEVAQEGQEHPLAWEVVVQEGHWQLAVA